MRTKLFLAFFAVITIALVSNLIFENFVAKDFEEYVSSAREDKLYWILASLEGGYSDGRWDEKTLVNTTHWATILGFDLKITDPSGREIITSASVMRKLSPSMQRRIEGIVDMGSASGEYEQYPLYVEGEEIGTMFARHLKRIGGISEKEALFRKRGKYFLAVSFLIAGGGAGFLAIFFSLFLSQPLKKMKDAVEALAKGDFSVRVPEGNKQDEVGKLSDSFNFMAEALQREEALRKHLTSNIAHELRTPLAVMKANVEAMIDGIVDNHERGLENIQGEIEKLITLVQGIEDITKAEASFFSGKDYSEIDLRDFAAGNVHELKPLAEGKGLEIKVINDLPVRVVSDRDKLEKILRNVITNAIKNTESGGIRIDYGLEKHMFFIEVTDTGAGIPEDRIDMVFRRFYRGEGSTGIGLGLAIVKELVEVMGGRIELKSRVGKGTKFRVWLPVENIQ